ncbi:MAG: hypothetical protein IJT36_06445 [Alphaproteobacteria bacterium]|nr:hypothetical protein [Alphaproteobacteria bacterium]
MKKRRDKFYTQIVNNCSAAKLVPTIKKLASSNSFTVMSGRLMMIL